MNSQTHDWAVLRHYGDYEHVTHSEIQNLEPLGKKITRAILVHPATPEVYESWDKFHDKCLNVAGHSLRDIHVFHAAVTEFIFRNWELMLLREHDPDKVLNDLLVRARKLGGPEYLLAECALVRYSMPNTDRRIWITDLPEMVAILATVGESENKDADTKDVREPMLARAIFEHLLSPYVPKLDGLGIPIVNDLMAHRKDELVRMRMHCVREAARLISEAPSETYAKDSLRLGLQSMEEEVRSIANLSKTSFANLIKSVLEDNVSWTTFAGLLGAGVAGLPPAVLASLGVTFFANLGALAVRARHEATEALGKSPFGFVYYAANERQR